MAKDKTGDYYLDGARLPRTPRAGKQPAAWGKTQVVGQAMPRVDGYERVSGAAIFPSDVRLPGMLYGAILRSPHPSARVRTLDARAARELPGVRVVLEPQSPLVQGLRWQWAEGVEVPLLATACRFEGEAVAAVAADTPYQARDALRAIHVDYQVAPFAVDRGQALRPGAPPVREGGNQGQRENHFRGDVARGFAAADAVVSQEFSTACQIHTPLEPHGCVASWDGDRLTVWDSTQGVFSVQEALARLLGHPQSKVRVIGHYVGGGFGAKLRPSKFHVIAALLARRAGRPVKLMLSREETYLAVGNRPASTLRLKAGAKKDGTLTALELEAWGEGGAFPAGGASLLDWLVRDLYSCPNVKTSTVEVFTNTGPARPFRAPGHPQCAFALEQVLDMLAHKLGLDPLQLRLKNIPRVSQARGGMPYSSSGLEQCLRRGAEAFGWSAARKQSAATRVKGGHLRRGVGLAGALWIAGAGRPPATVQVKVLGDGSINLNMGASDIGTGTKTVMAMVVAEELGVKPESVQVEHADTKTTQYASPSGGSKTVPTEAPAVRSAAIAAKQKLLALAARALKARQQDLVFKGRTIETTSGARRVTVAQLVRGERKGEVVGLGYRGPNPKDRAICPFAAQFCEVEVNTRTGEVRLVRFLGAHESGRVMNRKTFDNQAFGGITMGIGMGLTEERVLDRDQTGRMVNRSWHDYKLPTSLDVPVAISSLAVELPDPQANSCGAKGLGEPVTIPTAAAIANAIHDACGVRLTATPMGPLALRQALTTKEG